MTKLSAQPEAEADLPNALLCHFKLGKGVPRTLEELLQEIHRTSQLAKAQKFYWTIESALTGYYGDFQETVPDAAQGDAVTHLAAILKHFRDESKGLVKPELFGGLLESAIDEGKSAGESLWRALVIVRALCEIDPSLAFEEIIITDQSKRQHGDPAWPTPFELAAAAGATELVEVMTQVIGRVRGAASKGDSGRNHKPLLKAKDLSLDEAKPASLKTKSVQLKPKQIRTNPKKAFLLAAAKRQLGVMQHFLKHEEYRDAELADVGSLIATLGEAGTEEVATAEPSETPQNGTITKVDDPELQAFRLILERREWAKEEYTQIWTTAVTVSSEKVVKFLLETRSTEFATSLSARIIVEKGTAKMWELYRQKIKSPLREMLVKGHLLHTAVKFRKADIVDAMLEGFPDLAAIPRIVDAPDRAATAPNKGTEQYAIERLGSSKEDDAEGTAYKRIRDSLLHAMIRNLKLGMKEIREILKRAEGERAHGSSFDPLMTAQTQLLTTSQWTEIQPDYLVNSMSLLLSNVDTEEQSFAEFVEWLKDHKFHDKPRGSIFKFESVLRFAKFPDLSRQTPREMQDVMADLQANHAEIRIVFDWLRERGVTEVVELSVRDRLFGAHSDDDVAKSVNGFGIRILNWRKLDLYLGNLTEGNKLRELHLYSSGNRSVHDQWRAELPRFVNRAIYRGPDSTVLLLTRGPWPKLKKLHVNVVTNVLSKERVQQVKRELDTMLQQLGTQHKLPWRKRWTSGSVAEFDWAIDMKTNAGKKFRDLHEITNDVVGPNLSAFIAKYRADMVKRSRTDGESVRRTRVALIDSGVMIVNPNNRNRRGMMAGPSGPHETPSTGAKHDAAPLANSSHVPPEMAGGPLNADQDQQKRIDDLSGHIVEGKSFVTTGDNDEQLWWHASEPHGTQMARLICSVDPTCELYVAKVAETRSSGISANIVAEAIDWAIGWDVDIISLSLVTYTDQGALRTAIQRAANADIVVLASSADEGLRDNTDDFDRVNRHVLRVSACDQWGNLLPRSPDSRDAYRFLGDNVRVGHVAYLKSPDYVSGSSAATAIAAGVVSLIIAFARLSNQFHSVHDPRKDNKWRTSVAVERLNVMCDGSPNRFVVLENICGRLARGETLKNADFTFTVNNSFVRRWNGA